MKLILKLLSVFVLLVLANIAKSASPSYGNFDPGAFLSNNFNLYLNPAVTNNFKGEGGISNIAYPIAKGFATNSFSFYVATNGDDANDGLSWKTAKKSIGFATNAPFGSVVYLSAGDHYLVGQAGPQNEFIPADGISLIGAGKYNTRLWVTNSSGISPSSGNMYADMSFVQIPGRVVNFMFGSANKSTTVSNVTFRSVWAYDNDAVLFLQGNFEMPNWNFYDCHFISDFDPVDLAPGSASLTNSDFHFYNCVSISQPPVGATDFNPGNKRALVYTDCTVDWIGGSLECYNSTNIQRTISPSTRSVLNLAAGKVISQTTNGNTATVLTMSSSTATINLFNNCLDPAKMNVTGGRINYRGGDRYVNYALALTNLNMGGYWITNGLFIGDGGGLTNLHLAGGTNLSITFGNVLSGTFSNEVANPSFSATGSNYISLTASNTFNAKLSRHYIALTSTGDMWTNTLGYTLTVNVQARMSPGGNLCEAVLTNLGEIASKDFTINDSVGTILGGNVAFTNWLSLKLYTNETVKLLLNNATAGTNSYVE